MTEIHPAAVRYDRDHDVLRLHFIFGKIDIVI